MQYLDRSTLSNWVKYMAHNPDYFSYVFRVPFSEEALERAAVQTFGNSHVPIKGLVKHREIDIFGIKQLSVFLGISMSEALSLRYAFDERYELCGGQRVRVFRRDVVAKWAKRRKVGRFANGR